jgi:hypothetical protein
MPADVFPVYLADLLDTTAVVGMTLGGTLLQLAAARPPRPAAQRDAVGHVRAGGAPPDPWLLALWPELGEERYAAAELEWRVEHWRLLHGDVLPFDADEFRRFEERVAEHSGT